MANESETGDIGVIKEGVGWGRIRREELGPPCKSCYTPLAEPPFKCQNAAIFHFCNCFCKMKIFIILLKSFNII